MNTINFTDEDPLCDFDLNILTPDMIKQKFLEER